MISNLTRLNQLIARIKLHVALSVACNAWSKSILNKLTSYDSCLFGASLNMSVILLPLFFTTFYNRESPISHLTLCLFHKSCHGSKFTYFTLKSYLFHTLNFSALRVRAKWKMYQETLPLKYFPYYHLTIHIFCKQGMKYTNTINVNACLTLNL